MNKKLVVTSLIILIVLVGGYSLLKSDSAEVDTSAIQIELEKIRQVRQALENQLGAIPGEETANCFTVGGVTTCTSRKAAAEIASTTVCDLVPPRATSTLSDLTVFTSATPTSAVLRLFRSQTGTQTGTGTPLDIYNLKVNKSGDYVASSSFGIASSTLLNQLWVGASTTPAQGSDVLQVRIQTGAGANGLDNTWRVVSSCSANWILQ